MKPRSNYGYPLSSVLIRMFFAFCIALFIIVLFCFNLHVYLIFALSLPLISLYLFFGIILFKKRFYDYRMSILNKMIDLSDLTGNEVILDLGSGAGPLAIGFAKHLKDGRVYGVDRYALKYTKVLTKLATIIKINFIGNTLKNAKLNAEIENVSTKVEFVTADLTKPFTFPSGYFDIILSSQFLYCVPHQQRRQILQEINRILKKDGRIIFFESRAFFKWNITDVADYFKNIGYYTRIISLNRRTDILFGKRS